MKTIGYGCVSFILDAVIMAILIGWELNQENSNTVVIILTVILGLLLLERSVDLLTTRLERK